MILLALPAICLFHCAKPAAAHALENDTGKDVRIEVTYRGADNRTVAVVAAGSRMSLQAPFDQVEAVHYTYDGHACVLTHDQVVAQAKPVVKLEPCA